MGSDRITLTPMTRRTFLATSAATAVAATATAADISPSMPVSNGFTPQGLARIPQVLQGSVNAGGVPGVVSLIWRKGEIVQVNTAGVRDFERKLPMERTTIFRVASMTKPVTVATALTLVDEGKMKLEDPITKWAPEFANMRVLKKPDGPIDDTYPAPRVLTIEDLMTHRAGMPYGFAPASSAGALDKFGSGIYLGLYSSLSTDDWIKAFASQPLVDAPGERFNYGVAIDVLGVIVGRAAGTSFRQAVRDRVCGPLGMNDTDFWIPPEKRDRQAALYIADPAHKNFLPVPTSTFDPGAQTFVSGGGGLVTTADDYLTFARMLLGGGEVNGKRLLKTKTVKIMTTNRLTPAQRKIPVSPFPMPIPGIPAWNVQGFGLGLSMITDPIGYAARGTGIGSAGSLSWSGMFGGWWQADPVQDMVLLWLVQALPGFIASTIPGAPPAPPMIPAAALVPGSFAAVAFQKQIYAALSQ